MAPTQAASVSSLLAGTSALACPSGYTAIPASELKRNDNYTYLQATDGYQIIWPVCGIPILAAIPLVYRLMRVEPSGKPEPTLG